MNHERFHAPSVFESFNARNLTPRQVADTFIPPEHFDDLCSRTHTLIIGPRGSGKTTLLKMLQLPALRAWQHDEAERYIEKIDFTGVFIPADIGWGAQVESLGGQELPKFARNKVSLCAFTTHVLISLVEAMRDCMFSAQNQQSELSRFRVELSRDDESKLVALIAKSWLLQPHIPSFVGLKFALRDRLSLLSQFAERHAFSSARETRLAVRDEKYLHIGFLESAAVGIEAFNEAVEQPDRKWGLLFDELEIAPERIRHKLLRSLRSVDERFLFKLSLSPYTEDFKILSRSHGPMSSDDYFPIELWYAHKEDAHTFSSALLGSMLQEYGCETQSAETIFGTSEFDVGRHDQIAEGSAYKPGSHQYQKFRLLAEKDKSFERYLKRYNINLKRMHLLKAQDRASFIRKITSMVAVRNAFRGEMSGRKGELKALVRSRKNPGLYAGANSLFAIAEGNPRWFIGMIGPFVREYAGSKRTVSKSMQARGIAVASNRFRALLGTIPFDSPQAVHRHASVLGLLDAIGEYFFKRIVVDDFEPEPPISFVVDRKTPSYIIDALGRALNAGAIVYIPDKPGEPVLGSLADKRFRLSYMLASYYKLPLTIGKGRALSALLGSVDSESVPRLI